MSKVGMTLSSEEHEPRRLVEMARMAEDHGFDFVSISDHFHPWISEQGHSPFVWSVLGAIAEATKSIEVGVGVTCPTIRIHPAILAQATATTAQLLPDRFFWGVGSGEALNEQVLGDAWPPAEVRLEMLEESIELIREMWKGESTTWRGDYYLVEDATIFDPPPSEVPIIVSAFGEQAAELAARVGDGLWITGPGQESIDHYRQSGGKGPVYTQLHVCWAENEDEAIETAHRIWPNTALPGQLAQDLRTPLHFEEATELVAPEMVAEAVPCGPDPKRLVEGFSKALESGVDHVYFHQIGPDQEGFLNWFEDEVRPALEDAA